jgi:hypothetical protein
VIRPVKVAIVFSLYTAAREPCVRCGLFPGAARAHRLSVLRYGRRRERSAVHILAFVILLFFPGISVMACRDKLPSFSMHKGYTSIVVKRGWIWPP